jgi:hypothetical protein
MHRENKHELIGIANLEVNRKRRNDGDTRPFVARLTQRFGVTPKKQLDFIRGGCHGGSIFGS